MTGKDRLKPSTARSLGRRAFLKGAAASVALLGAPAFIRNVGASKLRKVKFQLAWIPSGQFASAFVSQELGFWSEVGLDVQIDRGFGSATGANNVAAGVYEVAEVSFSAMVVTVSKGGPLVTMGARYQKSPIGVLALKKAGIRKPKDMEGKTVATNAGSGAQLLLPAFARASGLDLSKINFIFVDGAALNTVLLAGRADASMSYYVSGVPPFMGRDIEFDYLFFADYGLDMLDQVYLTQPKRLKEDRELFENFVKGALKGVAYSYLEPEKSIEITMKKLPLYGEGEQSRRLIEVGLGVATAMGISPYVEKHGLGWMEPSLVKDSVEKTVSYMGAAKIADVESLYTNEFIGKVKLTAEQWAKVREYSKKYLPS